MSQNSTINPFFRLEAHKKRARGSRNAFSLILPIAHNYFTYVCICNMFMYVKNEANVQENNKIRDAASKSSGSKKKQELLVACIIRGDILLRDPSPFVFFTLCLYFLMRFLLILLLLLIPLIAS